MTAPCVYLVTAMAGEYEGRRQWPVAAYTDRELAVEHARLAQEEERRLGAWLDADENCDARFAGSCPRNAYDTTTVEDWEVGRASYAVEAVVLLTALPQVAPASLPTPASEIPYA